MSTIELKNINKSFGTGTSKVHVLKDVNFQAEKGELVLVLGPSGSGKSTFLTITGGLQTPSSGEVKLNEQPIGSMTKKSMEKTRLDKIGFVLQAYNLVPYLTVKEQFTLVDKVKPVGNISSSQLTELLGVLDIADTIDKYPAELSGGQNQRVAIARALYTDPEIVLADEPTASLDTDRVKDVGNLLRTLAKEQDKAIVVVTHDLRLKDYADKIYQIMDGKMTLQEPETAS